jgi:hypothetical protein
MRIKNLLRSKFFQQPFLIFQRILFATDANLVRVPICDFRSDPVSPVALARYGPAGPGTRQYEPQEEAPHLL